MVRLGFTCIFFLLVLCVLFRIEQSAGIFMDSDSFNPVYMQICFYTKISVTLEKDVKQKQEYR